MQIRIYDRTMAPLAVLFAGDYNGLTYRDVLMDIGDASFTMRLDNPKTTSANLNHYNIVEICEDDGTPRWVGLIIKKTVTISTVAVSCYSLAHILSKRLTAAADARNAAAGIIVNSLLATTNTTEDTNILVGDINLATNVQITFDRSSILDAINNVKDASSGQWKINPDRTLDFKSQVGEDLSASVLIQYQLGLIASANITTFSVDDDGTSIISKTYGKSDPLSSTQTDTALHTEFGLLEATKNFRELDNQTSLDNITANSNNGSAFSPALDLLPSVPDNFEVGDLISVQLSNGMIDIDDVFQVTEKTVVVQNGAQKAINIKIISNVSDFFKQIRDMKKGLDLISRSV